MRIELIRENEDGSADFSLLDMTADEITAFVRLGMVKALEEAIEDAKKYDPNLVAEVKEPVAWVLPTGELVVRPDFGGKIYYSEQSVYNHAPTSQNLVAPEPVVKQWVGLTEEEVFDLKMSVDYHEEEPLVLKVEEYLRKKNT